MENTCCIILAAGEGKRMKSSKPKVLSDVVFKPMLGWILDTVLECKIKDICVVTGFKHEMVEDFLNINKYECDRVIQTERKGTAHAVKTAENFLKCNLGKDVLILAGDAPFISKEIIEDAYNEHMSKNNAVTLISADVENPYGYGRVLRNKGNGVIGIIEEKDADENEREIKEVNSGAYWFSIDSLLKVLYNISNDTSQGEYYLTDAVKLLIQYGCRAGVVKSKSPDIVFGANDCMQLVELNRIARERIIEKFVSHGVSIPCWDGVVIGKDVEINKGSAVFPGTVILGNTIIGNDCIIGPNSQIYDCCVGNNTSINSSYCIASNIRENSVIGPFAKVINEKSEFSAEF